MANEHPLDKYHSLKPPTVAKARESLDERLERAFDGATPAQIVAALDALIAAVRAEYRPDQCADHPTAEMVTVCETCIEEQIPTREP